VTQRLQVTEASLADWQREGGETAKFAALTALTGFQEELAAQQRALPGRWRR
jgi:hypothetical protein